MSLMCGLSAYDLLKVCIASYICYPSRDLLKACVQGVLNKHVTETFECRKKSPVQAVT